MWKLIMYESVLATDGGIGVYRKRRSMRTVGVIEGQ